MWTRRSRPNRQESLGMIASQGRFRVFVIAPELEAIFFSAPDVLEALVGRRLTSKESIRGRYEPKRVLLELLQDQSWEPAFLGRLPILNVDLLREHPVVRELEEFVRQSRVEAVAA